MSGKWRFFPWYITGAMTVVVAVNFGMAYTALHTFPGNAGGDGFDLSNHYNVILNRMEQQSALGWDVQAETDNAGHPVVLLKDRAGAALAGAGIEATAERPVGEPRTTNVLFSEVSPGRYVATSALDVPGQWELLVSASAAGQALRTTRRLVVR